MELEIKNKNMNNLEAAKAENPDVKIIQLKFTDNNGTEYIALPIQKEDVLEKIDAAKWNKIFSASKEFFRRLMTGNMEIIDE